MWQIAAIIVQAVVIIAALALLVPVRFIKNEYFPGERITVLVWLSTLGKRNRARLDAAVREREQAKLLHANAEQQLELMRQRQQSDSLLRFWDEHRLPHWHTVPGRVVSPWKPVDKTLTEQHSDKEHGSDNDSAAKDTAK